MNQSIIPTFTKQGWLGSYSSYIGIVPNSGIGFVLLAADKTGAPDLNAYADIIGSQVLPAAMKASAEEAIKRYAGQFRGAGNDTLVITQDDLPGLSIATLTSNGQDVRATIAKANGIKTENLDMRLYPTIARQGSEQTAWRAVFQDKAALVDAGTPTCVTWQNVDQLVLGNVALDEFIFDLEKTTGRAAAVEIPALCKKFSRVQNLAYIDLT